MPAGPDGLRHWPGAADERAAASERSLQNVDAAIEDGHHIKAQHGRPGPQTVAVLLQPPGGQPADPGLFAPVDCLRRLAKPGTRPGLDLAKDQGCAGASDQVQFSLPAAPVTGEYLVAALEVPGRGAVFSRGPKGAPVLRARRAGNG